jgi:hypothetical protein
MAPSQPAEVVIPEFFRDSKSRHDGFERMFVNVGGSGCGLPLKPIDIPELSRAIDVGLKIRRDSRRKNL